MVKEKELGFFSTFVNKYLEIGFFSPFVNKYSFMDLDFDQRTLSLPSYRC